MKDCIPRMTAVCEEKTLQQATAPSGTCPSWEVCLPFGGQLSSNGGCVNYTPGTPPPDGVYSKITIADGCIISAELADIPLYTSAPCAPVPTPCDCGGEGGALPDPSTTAGNLFKYDASGRPLVKLSVTAGSGISVLGTGTSDDPLVITNTQPTADTLSLQSGNAALTVSGTGEVSDPWQVSHVTRLSGVYGAFTFDEYGHLISYNTSSRDRAIRDIIAGDGIKVTIDSSTDIATVALEDPQTVLTGDYVLGGYTVTLFRNRILNIVENIVQTAGLYNMTAVDGGQYAVTLNDRGSVEDIVYTPPPTNDPTQVSTSATKKFTLAGETSRDMTIVTSRNSAFRISYMDNNIPGDMQLFVDGASVDGLYFPQQTLNVTISGGTGGTGSVTLQPWRFEAAPLAIYAAGEHIISLACFNGELGFTNPGILDILLTSVQ